MFWGVFGGKGRGLSPVVGCYRREGAQRGAWVVCLIGRVRSILCSVCVCVLGVMCLPVENGEHDDLRVERPEHRLPAPPVGFCHHSLLFKV